MNMTAEDVITVYEAGGNIAPIKNTMHALITAPMNGKVIATTDLKTVKATLPGCTISMPWGEYQELIKHYYNHGILYWEVEGFHDVENPMGATFEAGIVAAMCDMLGRTSTLDRTVTLVGHVPNDPSSRVAAPEVEGAIKAVMEGFFESVHDERTDDPDYAMQDIDEDKVYRGILPVFREALSKYRAYYSFEVVRHEIPDSIKWYREHMKAAFDTWVEEGGNVRENDGSITDLKQQPEQ